MKYFDDAVEEAASRLFAEAQEELISHLLRSNVTEVAPAQQREWLDDTIGYLGDRYPKLSGAALRRLRAQADGYLAHGTLQEPQRRIA
jgi:hypothetical protein